MGTGLIAWSGGSESAIFPHHPVTLSHRTDFALRTLMYLGRVAAEKESRRVASAEIARVFDIPLNHLVKIVHQLAQHGYVHTTRGPGGGVELARSPEDIRIGQVIDDFQGPLQLHDCVSSPGLCAIESFCKLQSIFRQGDALQRDFLNRHTLADVIPAATEA